MKVFTETDLLAIDGVLWEKDEIKRIYFNNLYHYVGLVLIGKSYNHFATALLYGKEISYSRAKRILIHLNRGKFYYDVKKGCFGSDKLYPRFSRKIESEIKKILRSKNYDKLKTNN